MGIDLRARKSILCEGKCSLAGTLYTHEAWHNFIIPRQMAVVLERQIGMVLGGCFQTEVKREPPRE
jgi:hypothetical protein